jgi:hypothetical protein
MACTVREAPHCWQRRCMRRVALSLSSSVSTLLQPGHSTYLGEAGRGEGGRGKQWKGSGPGGSSSRLQLGHSEGGGRQGERRAWGEGARGRDGRGRSRMEPQAHAASHC